jgi:hypothetical protein
MSLGTGLHPAETGRQYALCPCRGSNLVAVEVVLEARDGIRLPACLGAPAATQLADMRPDTGEGACLAAHGRGTGRLFADR